VGLEGEDEEIRHQANVLAEIAGDAGGPLDAARAGRIGRRRYLVDAALDLTDRGQIFIEAAEVGVAELAAQAVGGLADKIEYALIEAFAHRPGWIILATRSAGKEPIKHQPWIDLLGIGSAFGTPGEIGGIGATITGVAIACLAATFDADFQGGKTCGSA